MDKEHKQDVRNALARVSQICESSDDIAAMLVVFVHDGEDSLRNVQLVKCGEIGILDDLSFRLGFNITHTTPVGRRDN